MPCFLRLALRQLTRIPYVSWLLVVLAGCASRLPQESTDARFERLTQEFLAGHFAQRPLEAVALGWHQYDGQFPRWDCATLIAEGERVRRFDRALASFRASQLSSAHRRDWQLLRSVVDGLRWSLESQRPYWRNPMFYAGGLDVLIYFKRDFAPLSQRVRHAAAVLRHAPEFFADARANLEPTLPRPFVETAMEIADGSASFLEKEALAEARRADDAAAVAEFEAAQRVAVSELRDFAAWLKREKLPGANDRFALGRSGFVRMLRAERVELSPEQILELGRRELRAEQQRFAEAARVIDPSRPAHDVFKSIQRDHPTAESLLPDTRKNLEAIRQFVMDRRLVTIASDVRARVEETPPPQRATGFASMDTPGPFETRATEAYYYVTPTESHWPATQVEEWLTAFNYYTTDIVSIHEAYPGHYTQFLALNASDASPVAKVFANYAFVEGWAHYTEQLLIDEGFGQAGPNASREEQVRAARYRLAQSDEALLRLCRLCCAIQLHCHGMSVDEATRFFRENCYYEEKPARQEATRGTYDPGYLAYTLGKLQILKLRRDWQRQEGGRFSLQGFHDELLRHGAPPPRLLREWMLHDSASWPASL